MSDRPRVLITGIGGYIGSQLAGQLMQLCYVTGIDIRENKSLPCAHQIMDIRDPTLVDVLRKDEITHVVHLAAVLEDSGDRQRDFDIDVNGTRNVLDACVAAGVKHLTVTSSGAAYGYHADSPAWLDERDPLRGNVEFAYSDHKRQVEEMLASYRTSHAGLKQLILRPGTVLGENTKNLITNLFARKRLLAIAGSESPFVFIWDQDVVNIVRDGVLQSKAGIFNLAGDGALPIRRIATILGKPVLNLPPRLLRIALTIGRRLGIGRYGPEQMDFLRYRPVLSNQRLKDEFGYTPMKTSEQVFQFYVSHARARGDL
ncbi:SDR family oxidoreductase [Alcanivorax sp. 1008]|uniref:SDR family oxidoreductase n=1 Tax=Alcanivorax sp. 1008 TaxID=2816853 RepID=UPI001D2B837D|nr:SDR family oxidoreductase [Alcanivorax sp. 1008]MCC1496013.1 SDR family oxidoreductase [Alcanivorax sp. 1008]